MKGFGETVVKQRNVRNIVHNQSHPLTIRANHSISTLDMAGTSAEMQVSAFLLF